MGWTSIKISSSDKETTFSIVVEENGDYADEQKVEFILLNNFACSDDGNI